MPRRWIDPTLFTDEKLAMATLEERHLFVAMIANQDDDGRLLGHPGYLRSVAFPYDNFTNEEVKQMRDHLAKVNPNIIIYNNSGNEYIQLKRHYRYQRPRYYHQSRFPAPPGWPFKDEPSPSATLTGSNHEVTAQQPIKQPQSNHEVTAQYTEDRVGLGGVRLDLDKDKTKRIPTVSAGSVEPATKAKNKKPPGPLVEEREKVFEGLKERRGYNSPQAGAEANAITWMLKQNYFAADILSAYDQLKQDTFWRNKLLNMQSVKAQIGEIIKARRHHERRDPKEREPPANKSDSLKDYKRRAENAGLTVISSGEEDETEDENGGV